MELCSSPIYKYFYGKYLLQIFLLQNIWTNICTTTCTICTTCNICTTTICTIIKYLPIQNICTTTISTTNITNITITNTQKTGTLERKTCQIKPSYIEEQKLPKSNHESLEVIKCIWKGKSKSNSFTKYLEENLKIKQNYTKPINCDLCIFLSASIKNQYTQGRQDNKLCPYVIFRFF